MQNHLLIIELIMDKQIAIMSSNRWMQLSI